MKMKSVLMGTAAACLIAFSFYSNDAVASDSGEYKPIVKNDDYGYVRNFEEWFWANHGDSIVIKCDPDVKPGTIIMTNPPKISCGDLDLFQIFVGTGLEFGPFIDTEKLQEQIAEFQPQTPQTESKEKTVFDDRRERAYQELDDYNAMIRSTAPGYPDVKSWFRGRCRGTGCLSF